MIYLKYDFNTNSEPLNLLQNNVDTEGYTAIEDEHAVLAENTEFWSQKNNVVIFDFTKFNLRILDNAKSVKKAEIKAIFNTKLYADFTFRTHVYDFPDKEKNLAYLVSLCNSTAQIGWHDKDNNIRITDTSVLKQFHNALVVRGTDLFIAKKLKNVKIYNATTVAQVNNINWS